MKIITTTTPTVVAQAPAHDDVRFAPTPSAPPPPPFSPLDMHPHRSHLASPQTPHLAPPPLPAPPALKHTRSDSPPPASPPPQDALRTGAASQVPTGQPHNREYIQNSASLTRRQRKNIKRHPKDHKGWCPWVLSQTDIAPGILIIIQLKRK
jgi:hypothetical protein